MEWKDKSLTYQLNRKIAFFFFWLEAENYYMESSTFQFQSSNFKK